MDDPQVCLLRGGLQLASNVQRLDIYSLRNWGHVDVSRSDRTLAAVGYVVTNK